MKDSEDDKPEHTFGLSELQCQGEIIISSYIFVIYIINQCHMDSKSVSRFL